MFAIKSGSRLALQKTGRDTFVLHSQNLLDVPLANGLDVSVKYQGGRGVVMDQNLSRQQDQGR